MNSAITVTQSGQRIADVVEALRIEAICNRHRAQLINSLLLRTLRDEKIYKLKLKAGLLLRRRSRLDLFAQLHHWIRRLNRFRSRFDRGLGLLDITLCSVQWRGFLLSRRCRWGRS